MNTRLLFWILFTLNIIDVGLTTIILQLGGSEFNAYLLPFMERFGDTIGIALAKALPLGIMATALFLLHKYRHNTNLANIGLLIMCTIYTTLNIYSTNLLINIVDLTWMTL